MAPSTDGLHRDLIVVGASAGGVETLSALVETLPTDLPAAVCIVQHLAPAAPSLLGRILDRRSALPVETARDGAALEPGRVYVATPDRHLLVTDGVLRLTLGPKENRSRPAIDVLFRSAAATRGSRVIGVLLSGMLDDGVTGLVTIKQRGGLVVVQDPEEALFPSMPQNALARVDVDHCLPVAEIGRRLDELCRMPAGPSLPLPEDVAREVELAERFMDQHPSSSQNGVPAPFSCPDCGGTLYERDAPDLPRYRCRVGHAFSEQALMAAHDESVEHALWAATRALAEQAHLLERVARRSRTQGRAAAAAEAEQRADRARAHADRILALLEQGSGEPEAPAGPAIPHRDEPTAG